ncbi:hypothetical protein Cni_G15691 [Canna indica]|uniref:Uncharacterized protein n=1 Tax=Canna indica TaxID=4628 RepID=A0AAQ3KJY3_9LILI|nr:hypothetical protein Cni_G15691 [Canna indica]
MLDCCNFCKSKGINLWLKGAVSPATSCEGFRREDEHGQLLWINLPATTVRIIGVNTAHAHNSPFFFPVKCLIKFQDGGKADAKQPRDLNGLKTAAVAQKKNS